MATRTVPSKAAAVANGAGVPPEWNTTGGTLNSLAMGWFISRERERERSLDGFKLLKGRKSEEKCLGGILKVGGVNLTVGSNTKLILVVLFKCNS